MKNLIGLTGFLIFTYSIFAGDLYQLGTIESMMKGYYEKVKDISEVKSIASMGLGTTINLGEVIGIDKKFYIANSEGNIKLLDGKTEVPYLTCSSFSPENSFSQENLIKSSKDFYSMLEKKYLKGDNTFYAIRVDGLFQKVEARSEDAFNGKTEPLGEWLKTHQKSFIFNNIQGTLVIFKYPKFMTGIGVGGYHAHFISEDRKVGGHVFDFSLIKGNISIESYNAMTLILPESDKFVKANFEELGSNTKESISKIETKQN